MTDAIANQLAIVAPVQTHPDAQANQFAIVTVVSAIPPPAGGGLSHQLAIVSVSREIAVPIQLHGYLVKSLQGFPYYIEE